LKTQSRVKEYQRGCRTKVRQPRFISNPTNQHCNILFSALKNILQKNKALYTYYRFHFLTAFFLQKKKSSPEGLPPVV
ncbi:MAG: hypothetical protein Q4A51_06905, partial [Lachnospiraceae bacterium]|nr:hypothetical protein [Lachnospiraceae bacterium]